MRNLIDVNLFPMSQFTGKSGEIFLCVYAM